MDFLVTRDEAPWFLAEVKSSAQRLSLGLARFQRVTGARHAFQVVVDDKYVDADCFSRTDPVAGTREDLLEPAVVSLLLMKNHTTPVISEEMQFL